MGWGDNTLMSIYVEHGAAGEGIPSVNKIWLDWVVTWAEVGAVRGVVSPV
jgi:hypothetical protein